jgi:hypothetical protein
LFEPSSREPSASAQRDAEFAGGVGSSLPVQVIGEVLGAAEADRPKLRDLARLLHGSQDPELARAGAEPTTLAVNAGAPIRYGA